MVGVQGAIVLAGGRSSRLGGVSKAGLEFEGETLLARAVAVARGALADSAPAASGAAAGPEPVAEPGRIAVVGPAEASAELLPAGHGCRLVREEPPFAGPAAALDAGMRALASTSGRVLVLACDMPGAGTAVVALLRWLEEHPESTGALAVDGGRDQPLAAIYPAEALRSALAAIDATRGLQNAPVHPLVARLEAAGVARVDVPAGSTADVDTWTDAAALGVGPGRGNAPGL
ncbi:molybdenum cofactor guanylyltransferase [Arthrobacter sp. 35W]|uniref:molybdenum cofactor guanylyltransferase n=1 Tax=Arthrobacter sp. 35W TaxID=1132441 RepID=UPI00041C0853|nr:NTP transferase domain-containing protein [Arthrobacter sp. 35W]